MLLAKIHERFDGPRRRREELAKDLGYVKGVLADGAKAARAQAAVVLSDVQRACGVGRT